MCNEPSCHTIENWGRKERVCSKCGAILMKSISAGKNVPVMMKSNGKYKSMYFGRQIIELSQEQIKDLERADGN